MTATMLKYFSNELSFQQNSGTYQWGYSSLVDEINFIASDILPGSSTACPLNAHPAT